VIASLVTGLAFPEGNRREWDQSILSPIANKNGTIGEYSTIDGSAVKRFTHQRDCRTPGQFGLGGPYGVRVKSVRGQHNASKTIGKYNHVGGDGERRADLVRGKRTCLPKSAVSWKRICFETNNSAGTIGHYKRDRRVRCPVNGFR